MENLRFPIFFQSLFTVGQGDLCGETGLNGGQCVYVIPIIINRHRINDACSLMNYVMRMVNERQTP